MAPKEFDEYRERGEKVGEEEDLEGEVSVDLRKEIEQETLCEYCGELIDDCHCQPSGHYD